MTIIIHPNTIGANTDLSESAQMIVQWIPGSSAWIDSAAKDNRRYYYFTDEADLLSAILSGLHYSHLINLKPITLWVNPRKLFDMGHDGLEKLQSLINDEKRAPESQHQHTVTQIQSIVGQYDLFTTESFTTIDQFFDQFGIDISPFMLAGSFEDKLELLHLLSTLKPAHPTGSGIDLEAAEFAVGTALTLVNLFYRYRLYWFLTEKLKLTDLSKTDRQNKINDCLSILETVVESALDCPQVPEPLSQAGLTQTVSNWIGSGKLLGFRDLSTALSLLLPLMQWDSLEPNALTQSANRALYHIQNFFKNNIAYQANPSQTGRQWFYFYDVDSVKATLTLEVNGCLSITKYVQQN